MVRLSALAVSRLITNSSLVGNSTGSSLGAAPLTILTTWYASRRKHSRRSPAFFDVFPIAVESCIRAVGPGQVSTTVDILYSSCVNQR
jgi:hypothetical protein